MEDLLKRQETMAAVDLPKGPELASAQEFHSISNSLCFSSSKTSEADTKGEEMDEADATKEIASKQTSPIRTIIRVVVVEVAVATVEHLALPLTVVAARAVLSLKSSSNNRRQHLVAGLLIILPRATFNLPSLQTIREREACGEAKDSPPVMLPISHNSHPSP